MIQRSPLKFWFWYHRIPYIARKTAAAKTVKKKKSAASKAMTRVTNSAMSTIGRELGRSIIRGIFGSIK